MNQDQLHGIWMQCRGMVKEQWGTLTDNPRAATAGTRDRLAGRSRERRGIARQDADQQLADFMSRNRNWWDPSGR